MLERKRCKDIVAQEKDRELARLQAVLAIGNKAPPDDGDNVDTYLEQILCVDKSVRHRILLSTGGPGDGFIIETKSGEVSQAWYFYEDWADYAEIELYDGDLQAVAEMFGYLAWADDQEGG